MVQDINILSVKTFNKLSTVFGLKQNPPNEKKITSFGQLDFLNFSVMRKLAIFSAKCDFPYF